MNQLLNVDYSTNNKSILKRIMNEHMSLLLQGCNVESKHINNEFEFIITFNNNKYKIILPNNYPFVIPTQIYLNGVNYKNKIYINEKRVLACLKKHFGLECLCCSSVLCGANWMPTMSMIHIVNEINNIYIIKKQLLLYMLYDSIKSKYNCEFAYFEKYLL